MIIYVVFFYKENTQKTVFSHFKVTINILIFLIKKNCILNLIINRNKENQSNPDLK
jgi:hypothetical protein